MTNLKTTIKALSIAAAVSFSMNAMAVQDADGKWNSIPGLPSGFTMDSNPALLAADNTALSAITNMNSVLSTIGSSDQGGTNIGTDNFWNLFHGNDVTYFDYEAAKANIEELIYTVEGKVWNEHTGAYEADGTTTDANGVTVSFETSNGIHGTSVTEDMHAKQLAGIRVLSALGFDADLVSNGDASQIKAKIKLVETAFAGLISDATLTSNGQEAYINANDLIKAIAGQNDSGKIVNVTAAATALQGLISRHNNFLGANILATAIELRDNIKTMAIQVVASGTAKGAAAACAGQDLQNPSSACTAIGTKFSEYAGQVTDGAVDYDSQLLALGGYAESIIAFNGNSAVAAFDGNASAFAADINTLGVIEAGLEDATDASDFSITELDIAGDFNDDGTETELFDSALEIEGVTIVQ